jgi:hypothetical protein
MLLLSPFHCLCLWPHPLLPSCSSRASITVIPLCAHWPPSAPLPSLFPPRKIPTEFNPALCPLRFPSSATCAGDSCPAHHPVAKVLCVPLWPLTSHRHQGWPASDSLAWSSSVHCSGQPQHPCLQPLPSFWRQSLASYFADKTGAARHTAGSHL